MFWAAGRVPCKVISNYLNKTRTGNLGKITRGSFSHSVLFIVAVDFLTALKLRKTGRNSQFILPWKFPLFRWVISKGFFVSLIVVTNENTTKNTWQMNSIALYDLRYFKFWTFLLLELSIVEPKEYSLTRKTSTESVFTLIFW
jgi:hypothetical protein